MSFSADISKFAKKTGLNADKVVKKVVLDLTRSVVKRTPVDTGRARAAWQVGKSLPSKLPSSSGPTDKTGQMANRSARVEAASIKAGDIVYIANNVDYIIPLEYGSSE